MSLKTATESEVRALGVALKCLAASLKQNGALHSSLYTTRLQGHIDAEYPAVDNKEIFDLTLENLIKDLARVPAPDA
ncbi:hypothetical protein [Pseudomonas sp. 382]|uniref:hypothetical protein n=1 Tax=Pseudomonas sp. 382 TaxID=1751969 RepID=UPI000C1A1061|nr:hypothetical protein [Pseudomonas sp. 382]PIK75541.1 hypothetical protein CQW31_26685 [Pseudomonas sp. 382]